MLNGWNYEDTIAHVFGLVIVLVHVTIFIRHGTHGWALVWMGGLWLGRAVSE